MGRAGLATQNTQRFALHGHQAAPRQRPRRRAGILQSGFQLQQIVRTRMQFQEGQKLPLGFREFVGGTGGEFHAQMFARRTKGIALHMHLLRHDESALLQSAHHVSCQGELLLQRGGR
jgi:hypothetical protein